MKYVYLSEAGWRGARRCLTRESRPRLTYDAPVGVQRVSMLVYAVSEVLSVKDGEEQAVKEDVGLELACNGRKD